MRVQYQDAQHVAPSLASGVLATAAWLYPASVCSRACVCVFGAAAAAAACDHSGTMHLLYR